MGQLAPMLQLAVKDLKISHLCSVPTGPDYKAFKYMETNEKRTGGRTKKSR